MKELQTRNAPKLRILETETDYHILYTEESVSTTTYGFRLSWGALAVLAAIGMLCLTLFVAAQGRDTTPPPPSGPSVTVPDGGAGRPSAGLCCVWPGYLRLCFSGQREARPDRGRYRSPRFV